MAFTDYTDEVFQAIKAFLPAQWTATPIAWPNEAFQPPVDSATPPAPAPFIAVEITGTLYGQESIGEPTQAQNRWDEEGVLWVHVMVPTGSGSGNARGGAKQVARIFRGTTLLSGRLEFRDARIGEGEPGDDNGTYFRISVSIDWRCMDA